MLSDFELKRIAKDFVNKSMRIGKKENPFIKVAKKKFGRIVDKFLIRKNFPTTSLNEKEKKIAEKLKDPIFGPLLVEYKGKFHVKTKIGHTVRIVYSQADKECIKLASYIKQECWRNGAHVIDIPSTSKESRLHVKISPFDSLAELPKLSELLSSAIDFRIFLGGEEDEMWAKGLEEKIKVGALATQRIKELIDKHKVKWCYFGWPVKKKKGQIFVDEKIYRKIFYDAIKETFNPRLQKICKKYFNLLQGAETIQIKSDDGTDLEFSIKNRPWLVADGILSDEDIKRGDLGLNIPDGEIFIAPIEKSANGYILFDHVAIHGFGLIKNLDVRFKDGKIIWYSADEGKETFKKFLDANVGEKDRIAEFGIGTNLKAKFVGETIIDEKIFGTIHIAVGHNMGAYKGKNKASSHQDCIKVMKGKNGNVYADGKLVMKNGIPI